MGESTHADHARSLGLIIVPREDLSISREQDGDGFAYRPEIGSPSLSKKRLAEIEALVLPPNWRDVRIAAKRDAHLQAVGYDEAGRLQYRYHDEWVEVRNRVKSERLAVFGAALPAVREAVEQDLRTRKFSRRTAAAAAIALIDRKLIRPGHEKYAANGTTGAATLSQRHIRFKDGAAQIAYTGKSGKTIEVDVKDALLRRRLKAFKRNGRGRVFTYRQDGRKKGLKAGDINAYLRKASGKPISAKDFRTFRASAQALFLLCEGVGECGEADPKLVPAVMKDVSRMLRNTPAVARSSYVHPPVVTAFEEGALDPALIRGRLRRRLDRPETALMRFLEART